MRRTRISARGNRVVRLYRRLVTGVLVMAAAFNCTGCSQNEVRPAPTVTKSISSSPAPTSSSGSADGTSISAATPLPTRSLPPSVVMCQTAQLRVTVTENVKDASQGAKSQVATIHFVNTGTTECFLDGHPGVSFVEGKNLHAVGASAHRDGVERGKIYLKRGGAAVAKLTIALAGSLCADPVAVEGLQIYPPDNDSSIISRRTAEACREKTRDPQLVVGGVAEAE